MPDYKVRTFCDTTMEIFTFFSDFQKQFCKNLKKSVKFAYICVRNKKSSNIL